MIKKPQIYIKTIRIGIDEKVNAIILRTPMSINEKMLNLKVILDIYKGLTNCLILGIFCRAE